MKVETPFLVHTIRDIGDMPEGSGIHVHTVLKNHYKGFWSSMWGTYEVKVKKKDVKEKK